MAEDENSVTTDLWGNPVYVVPRKRGRPQFQWTRENSNKVSMLLALGWSNDRIADCILDPRTGKPISTPTLKRHFRSELSRRLSERDRLEAKKFEITLTKALEGNVGALRHLEVLIEKNDRALLDGQIRKAQAGSEKKEPKRGKKEQAAADAQEVVEQGAGGDWGSDLTPGVYRQ